MELNMYFTILARRWRLAALVALGVVVLSVLASQFISPSYQAETRLRIVTPLGGSMGETNYQTTFATRLMNTYAQIATSEQVNIELKEKLGLRVLPDISVKIIPDSEIIQIVVESKDPALASKTANALADILFSYQNKAINSANSNELGVLSTRKDELKQELEEAQDEHVQLTSAYSETAAEIAILDRTIRLKESAYQNLVDQYEQVLVSEATVPSSITRATKDTISSEMKRIQDEINELNATYKQLLTDSNEFQQKIAMIRQSIQITQNSYSDLLYRYDTVLTAAYRQENAQNIIVVSPAVAPTRPSSPGRVFIVGLGVLCGLIVGIVAAFVVDSLDSRIFSLDKIGRVTSAPVIGSISRYRDLHTKESPDSPDSMVLRDYWILRARLQKIIEGGKIKNIMLTSPNRLEGRSFIACKLAAGFAQYNLKVLVVDADFYKPKQHQLFNVTGEHGLTEFLNGDLDSLDEMILTNVAPGVDLLPNLLESDDPTKLLGSSRLESLFEFIDQYDMVLFDTPAFLAVPDALELAKNMDGVIVVTRWGYTTSDDIRTLCNQLESLNSNILGVVVNQTPIRKNADSYHSKNG